MESLLTLTFGVEIEFMVLFNPGDYPTAQPDPQTKLPEEKRISYFVREHMIQILVDHGIPTNSIKDADFSKWTVATDGSVHPDDRTTKVSRWSAIELKTPVFLFHSNAMQQIGKVTEIVQSNFKTLVNRTCGLQ